MAGPLLTHWMKNIGLILLSILFLPIDSLILGATLLFHRVFPSNQPYVSPTDRELVVLVSGVCMAKGKVLADSLHQAGWRVIGADFSPLACGRVSRSLAKFYKLSEPKTSSRPYIEDLLRVVATEHVDLWVSCSSVASAVEDGEAKEVIEAKTSCKAIQFDIETTKMLHEKHTFLERAAKHGLTIPETHTVKSREDVDQALRKAPPKRRYIMKPIGMDDANRGDLTLLPKSTSKETAAHLSRLPITPKTPWILQQYIDGPEYCTHALVVRGQVKAFVACPSAELLMHYIALPEKSQLYRDMLQFTRTFAAKEGETFTGHLSFDFMVEKSTNVMYPIECNPRAHTAVVLFQDQPELASAYATYLDPKTPGETDEGALITSKLKTSVYWLGHDLVELLLQPIWQALLGQKPLNFLRYFDNMKLFGEHLISWKDGTYLRWDPMPWWWLYHVYWPSKFVAALMYGKRWSRLNVSTTKMFAES